MKLFTTTLKTNNRRGRVNRRVHHAEQDFRSAFYRAGVSRSPTPVRGFSSPIEPIKKNLRRRGRSAECNKAAEPPGLSLLVPFIQKATVGPVHAREDKTFNGCVKGRPEQHFWPMFYRSEIIPPGLHALIHPARVRGPLNGGPNKSDTATGGQRRQTRCCIQPADASRMH